MTVEDLACVIYADATRDALAEQLRPPVSGGDAATGIRAGGNEVEIVRNLDFDATRRRGFPDGFLHFTSRIEIFPDDAPAVSLDDQVRFVSTLLEQLWSHGVPAVASCDYEDRLPHTGGYRSTAVPWPDATA